MSGRTARAARRNRVRLLPAASLFSDALSALMVEEGHDYDRLTREEVNETIRACVAEYDAIWEEFMAWVTEGRICGEERSPTSCDMGIDLTSRGTEDGGRTHG